MPAQGGGHRELWGWILFLICALLFLIASIRDGDVLLAVASGTFLVSCVLFLLVHLERDR